MVKELNSENFAATIKEGAVVVDFWAAWCGPCKAIAPIVHELADDYEGRATVGKLNVDESGSVVERYGIQSIPTLLFFKNGELKEKSVGLRNKAQLASILDKYV